MSANDDDGFRPVRIAVLTVSDTRTRADDRSGDTLEERLLAAGDAAGRDHGAGRAGADAGDGAATADLADLQRVVTAAAGSLTALHGGSIEVVALEGPTLTVRMHGTCAGCSFTDATLERLVLPALRREAPAVQTVTIAHD